VRLFLLSALFCFLSLPSPAASAKADAYDLVVYGGTPAGIMAAVAAGRAGDKVVLIEPSYLLGGMMAGGLTKTDMGRTDAIGGFAREFYDRVLAYYKKTYGPNSPQVTECNNGYYFESKLAGQIFREMLAEAHVTAIFTKEQIQDVNVQKQSIVSLTTRNYQTGKETTFAGKVFIDATYEGDILPLANVMYRVGREARSEFNESMAGLTEGPEEYRGMGDHRVQTYNLRGGLTDNPAVVTPFPKPEHYYPEAAASLVATVKKKNLKSFRELYPGTDKWGKINGHYDSNSGDCPGLNFDYIEADFEARARIAQKIRDYWLSIWWTLQNDPSLPAEFHEDMKKWGVPKDEFMESNHVTPQIYVRTGRRMLGQYFLTQRDLTQDRFKDDAICLGNYGFDSHRVQLIQTEDGPKAEGEISGSTDLYAIPYRSLVPYGVKNLLVVGAVSASYVAYSSLRMEPVYMMIGQAGGLAAHQVIKDGKTVQDVDVKTLQAELKKTNTPLEPHFRPVVDIKVNTPPPYKVGEPIEFELVPTSVKAPLKTIAWNFDGSGAVQGTGNKVTYTFTNPRKAKVLLSVVDGDGLRNVTTNTELTIGENPVPDVELAHGKAKKEGHWFGDRGGQTEYYYRMGVTDLPPPGGDEPIKSKDDQLPVGDGKSSITYSTKLPRSGRYLVALAFPSTPSQATNTPVTVTHAGGESKLTIDQKNASLFAFTPLGEYRFDAAQPASVTVSNQGANGRVAADTVRWIWLGE